jgi:hypothetical protein
MIFGSVAVGVMLISYWLEPRSRWFVLTFAAGSAATAAYSWLTQVYPITSSDLVWPLAALQRFRSRGNV